MCTNFCVTAGGREEGLTMLGELCASHACRVAVCASGIAHNEAGAPRDYTRRLSSD